MPRVLVVADDPEGEVVMSEHVVPDHLRTEHARGQLAERVAWSVADAVQVEKGGRERRPRRAARRRQHATPYLKVGE